MSEIEINDIRTPKDFRGITFSKYKISDVKKELLNNLSQGKIENSCNWSAELICSGHFMDLWEIILLFSSKYIHIGNIKLPLYLNMRFDNFKDIVSGGYLNNELSMRNNNKIRKLFCELICVLCLSDKMHSFETVKVVPEDYDIKGLTNKLKAPNIGYIEHIFESGDPKELFIALNELSYSLSKESRNSVLSCYWIEWVIEFSNICKKKKDKCECNRREFIKVDGKYQKEVIWLVWHILIHRSKEYCDLTQRIMKSLLSLYCLKFTPAVIRRRKYLLYFACGVCCDTVNLNKDIVKNKDMVKTVCDKLDLIYKHIKKNEVSPGTDYLFNNKINGKTNLQKTVDKLERMSQLGNMIIRDTGSED